MVLNYTVSGVTLLRQTNSADISASFYSGDTLTDPGTVTVTLTKDDGTALLTNASTSGTGAAARTRALTATETANLDILTAVWSGTVSATAVSITSKYEVVGDHLFSIAEARAFDRAQLASSNTYSDAAIVAARQRITEWFESICGVSFFPRYRKVILDGAGSGTLLVPDQRVTSLRTAAIRASGGATWTALTSDELADVLVDPTGVLDRETLGVWTAGRRNVRVAYEYGHEQVPAPIKFAALKVLVNHVEPSNLSDRTIQTSGQFGSLMLATPNPAVRSRWFGYPVVDSILDTFLERVPGIG